ncbi:inactive protein RESTRICTED TEV MOVEMENT 2-like [Musa acuminata AAA Group]|uniref:SHSP domain-containing protein n=1 Tax=Musa acuminata subsp. malaccensis TaxID=214687 RepID=A0A804HWG0_MUSAM|nr:PREDICTED: inactive protein RESTRICTED TEV MOVEMENT 2-like [Musa acuminata subsp. malaccensis]
METRQRSTLPQRVYEDFVPQHELLREKDEDILVVNVAGFSKDQLKVKFNRHGKLEMTGERPLTDTKWSRFHKEFQVPDRSTLDRIRAKFYNGLLEITLPKSSGMAAVQDEPAEAVKQQDVKKNQESDAQKVAEDKKDQLKEPKGTEKVAGKDGDEDGEEGTERIDAGKKAAITPASYCGGKRKLVNLKLKIGKLNSGTYQARQVIQALVLTMVVSVGLGLYLHCKPSPKDS